MDHVEIEVGSPSEPPAASAGVPNHPEQGAGEHNQAVEVESMANESATVTTGEPNNNTGRGKRRRTPSPEHLAKMAEARRAASAKKKAAK